MKSIVPFLMLAIIGFATNCSDNNVNNVQSEVDETEEENDFRDSLAAISVVMQMYDGQEGEKPSYRFAWGRWIKRSGADRDYVKCGSADGAALVCNAYCADERVEVSYEDVNDS